MKSLAVTLPDGSQRHYDRAITARDVAREISKRLEEAAVAAKIDDKEVDLDTPINSDCKLQILTPDSKEGLEVLRHSTAHLLAQAVKELYPGSQLTIGPVIEDGFFYDIDTPTQITVEDLPKIEARMQEISKRKLDVKRTEIPRAEAVEFFKKLNENYKAELIEGFPQGEPVSAYGQGDFIDLCRGPHVPNTGRLGHFKLLSVAGAYWRGDENNKMLQRIYGTTFGSKKQLDEHLKNLEEAKKRDHRKLAPELGLFTFLPAAPAMPFYLPKGTLLFNMLADFMRKETSEKLGFQEVICPQLMNVDLWKTSGHWYNYRENMFFMAAEKEEHMLGLKPMNCPGHCALFGSTRHSYRELPLRFSEYSKLHRNERAGVTHGVFRTRAFSQDDGHIFCTEEQIKDEVFAGIKHIFHVYKLFGFTDVEVKLATRPEKFIGTIENFDKATESLSKALTEAGVKFEILEGEGAFYGPKIEFHIKDSLKRLWQCGTIQLDYGLPEQFQLEYVDSESKAQRPVMIHRAVLGSLERFMGILIEHHAGHLPLWISPVQATVISVAPDFEEYAKEVTTMLKSWGVRAEADIRNEKLGYKIREAQLQRIPLMLVLGAKERDGKTLSVRKSNGETMNDLSLQAFKEFLEPQLKPGGNTH